MSSDASGAMPKTVDSTATQASGQTQNPKKSAQEVLDFRGTKHRVKDGDGEREVDYDELIADYQLKQASHKRFQEASAKEKQVQPILDALESGNIDFVVQKVGKEKAKALFEDFLIAQMEEDSLPEPEKRARTAEARAKALEEREKEREKQEQDRKQQELLRKAHAEIDKDVGEALKALGHKPTPRLVMRLCDEMIARLSGKGDQLSATDAFKYAKKGILDDIAEYLPQLLPEELIKTLPKEVVQKIRDYEVNKVLDAQGSRRTAPKARQKDPETVLSTDDWYKKREEKYGIKRRPRVDSK